MRRRTLVILVAVAVAAAGVTALIGCTTDYQKGLEDPNYGDPNALAGQRQPGPSSSELDEAGAGGGTPACVKAGGAIVDGGPCAVSLKNDILTAFSTANCNTPGSCHGGASPPNLPRIDPTDGPGMWAEFEKFQLGGKPYINPCSTDPAASAIACNVNQAAVCGTLMPPSLGLDQATVTKITDWLKCGSPNN